MKFKVSDEVLSANSKKKFCLSSMMILGIVSGFDVSQCPASMDLSTNSFDVEQLVIANKVKMKLVHLIVACICDGLAVNCQP